MKAPQRQIRNLTQTQLVMRGLNQDPDREFMKGREIMKGKGAYKNEPQGLMDIS